MALLAILAGAYWWWRRHPSPCPYGLRLWVQVPRPFLTRDRLRQALALSGGERVLEIGPGTGYYTPELALWVREGTVEILDIQSEMLDHTMRKVKALGITNVSAWLADAGVELPYPDQSVDAAVMVTVFGEIPDGDAALKEIRRVLKPGGRLVIGSIAIGDPHFEGLSSLRQRVERAGMYPVGSVGPPFAYFANFRK
jgi:ubiquinone/menaquinone biosynthesis C-methylase UbiE